MRENTNREALAVLSEAQNGNIGINAAYEELRAAIVRQAYTDYLYALQLYYVDGHRHLNERTEKAFERNHRRKKHKYPKWCVTEEDRREHDEDLYRAKVNSARHTIKECESFFRCPGFVTVSNKADGEWFIKAAHRILREWVDGERDTWKPFVKQKGLEQKGRTDEW